VRQGSTWPIRIALVALVLALCVRAGREAASPAALPPATVAADPVSGLVLPASAAPSRARGAMIGNWQERGDPGVVLGLAADGLATLDLRADGSTACVESGTFAVIHHDLSISYLAVGQSAAGYVCWSTRATLDYTDGRLVMPSDGDVFTRQG
jgi:hypothetical protein